jgi:U3 small nucleolar RNA-associated protein 25
MDDGNSTTTRLLTLLNISATKAGKRKRTYEDEFVPSQKLNKRKSIRFSVFEPVVSPENENMPLKGETVVGETIDVVPELQDNADNFELEGVEFPSIFYTTVL